jgi:hypothetical protein
MGQTNIPCYNNPFGDNQNPNLYTTILHMCLLLICCFRIYETYAANTNMLKSKEKLTFYMVTESQSEIILGAKLRSEYKHTTATGRSLRRAFLMTGTVVMWGMKQRLTEAILKNYTMSLKFTQRFHFVTEIK